MFQAQNTETINSRLTWKDAVSKTKTTAYKTKTNTKTDYIGLRLSLSGQDRTRTVSDHITAVTCPCVRRGWELTSPPHDRPCPPAVFMDRTAMPTTLKMMLRAPAMTSSAPMTVDWRWAYVSTTDHLWYGEAMYVCWTTPGTCCCCCWGCILVSLCLHTKVAETALPTALPRSQSSFSYLMGLARDTQ